jgi:hypothetical protein
VGDLKKDKAVPVTGREGSHIFFLDNRLINGGEVVKLTRQPPFTTRKFPGTHFCYRLSRPQGHSAAVRIRQIENIQ